MSKIFFILLCCICLVAPAVSQEVAAPEEGADAVDAVVEPSNAEETPAGDTEDEEDAAGEDEASVDDSDLDLQTYEGSDDIFVPTEEIPTDEPIPFPSDI